MDNIYEDATSEMDEEAPAAPVKRRSSKKTTPLEDPETIINNDDEKELVLRRQSILNKRRSVGLSNFEKMPTVQMEEKINQYIQLNAQNKITIKNVFSMEAIDLLTQLVKQKNSNTMSNFNVAGTSLEVGTKIYSLRVDHVHNQVLKMMGVIKENETEDCDENEENKSENASPKKTQKKKRDHALVTPAELKGKIEKFSMEALLLKKDDPQTTDLMYQSVCLIQADSMYLQMNSKNKFIDHLPKHENKTEAKKYPATFPTGSDQFEISDSFQNFRFLDWNPKEKNERSLQDENAFQFDLDASVAKEDYPDFPQETNSIEEDFNPGNPEICEFIARKVVLDKPFEYTYFSKNDFIHWAGPAHWTIKTQKLNNAGTTEGPKKRIKKETSLSFEKSDVKKAQELMKSNKNTQLLSSTVENWKIANLSLPDDMSHNIEQSFKYYLRPNTHVKMMKEVDEDETHLTDDEMVYDYENQHDATFCADLGSDGEGDDEIQQGPLTGDNLITKPNMVQDTYIPYSKKARRLDVKQLKTSIFTSIENNESEENFSSIYTSLPSKLSKMNNEALSTPIAFVSLLHLANEKCLFIESTQNYDDLKISIDRRKI